MAEQAGGVSMESIKRVAEIATLQRVAFAERFGREFKRQPPIIVRKEPEWQPQLIYTDPSRPRWTCAIATLGNALRLFGLFQPELDSEQAIVRECEGKFTANGYLGTDTLRMLIHNRSERGLKYEQYARFEDILEGLRHGKVALQDIGEHLVLLSKLAIQNEEVGVLVVNPLNRQLVPNFVSLKDLARRNSAYYLLSLEKANPSRRIQIKSSR